MSAWIVDAKVIDVVVQAMIENEKIDRDLLIFQKGRPTPDDLTALGRELWAMNVEAVRQRYPHLIRSGLPGHTYDVEGYQYRPVEVPDNWYVAKQIACLEYQCSEGDVPKWPLYKRLQAVRSTIDKDLGIDSGTTSLSEMPAAYKSAPWGDAY